MLSLSLMLPVHFDADAYFAAFISDDFSIIIFFLIIFRYISFSCHAADAADAMMPPFVELPFDATLPPPPGFFMMCRATPPCRFIYFSIAHTLTAAITAIAAPPRYAASWQIAAGLLRYFAAPITLLRRC